MQLKGQKKIVLKMISLHVRISYRINLLPLGTPLTDITVICQVGVYDDSRVLCSCNNRDGFAQKSQIQVYGQPLKEFTSTVLQGEVSFVLSRDKELVSTTTILLCKDQRSSCS